MRAGKYLTVCVSFGLSAFYSAGAGAGPAGVSDGIQCGAGACVVEQTGLPLRVLPRPNSSLYTAPEATQANVKSSNVRGLWPLYAFARKDLDATDPVNPKGWYQVGANHETPIGWMQAKDVWEWRNALAVAYSHPGKGTDARPPVLMYADPNPLEAMIKSPNRMRDAEAAYQKLKTGGVPVGVISVERSTFLNIDEKFYLFPVLDWKESTAFDVPARVLRVTTAVPKERAQTTGEDTVLNPEFRKEMGKEGALTADAAKRLSFDMVFAVDMTASMQPYIDEVLEALHDATLAIAQSSGEATGQNIRFGLVGYRDDVRAMPGLEFTARNFTPTLVDAAAMQRILKNDARRASVSSDDWEEDVNAGYAEAVKSAWNENSVRLMVLIGDASPHPVGHRYNTTNLDLPELRRQADAARVYVSAIYIQNDEAQSDWANGEDAFGALARNPGSEKSSLATVPNRPAGSVAKGIQKLVQELNQRIANARSGRQDLSAGLAPIATGDKGGKILEAGREAIDLALVDYKGDMTKAPRDVTAWVLDRDIIQPRREALNVRVLVSREDLDNMIRKLEDLMNMLAAQEATQIGFFEALQDMSARVSSGTKLDRNTPLGQSSLVPKWLAALPYRSDLAAMSAAAFEALTADERDQLQKRLGSKLEYYRRLSGNDKWTKLNDNDPKSRNVWLIPLDELP